MDCREVLASSLDSGSQTLAEPSGAAVCKLQLIAIIAIAHHDADQLPAAGIVLHAVSR
jgi:hypothetical protein